MPKTPKKVSAEPCKYKGAEVEVPGSIFNTPRKTYYATVLGWNDDGGTDNLILKFVEGGAKYWFPKKEVEGWLTGSKAGGGGGGAKAAARSPPASPLRGRGGPAATSPPATPGTQRAAGVVSPGRRGPGRPPKGSNSVPASPAQAPPASPLSGRPESPRPRRRAAVAASARIKAAADAEATGGAYNSTVGAAAAAAATAGLPAVTPLGSPRQLLASAGLSEQQRHSKQGPKQQLAFRIPLPQRLLQSCGGEAGVATWVVLLLAVVAAALAWALAVRLLPAAGGSAPQGFHALFKA